MIGLTIEKLSSMSRQDADALRAIAEVYHPTRIAEPRVTIAYCASTTQVGDGTRPGPTRSVPAANSGGIIGYWSIKPDALVAGQYLHQVDGVRNPETDVITWGVPYLSSLKVGNLSSIGSIGTLTTSGSIGRSQQAEVDNTPAQVASLAEQFLASVQDTAARVGATAKLHPDDNPAAGAPDQHALADQVFSGGAIPTSENVTPDPVVVFSGATPADQAAGWSSVSTVSIVSSEPDGASVFAIGATASDPARIFAGGGLIEQPVPNVHAAIPTPPPLPLVTPQTLPLQSDAATTVSPPPPPPPAPGPASASGAVATTSPAQVELDKAGLPWDGRIHASTKTKTAKDVWTRRRGVDDTLVAEVEAQLRAAMAVPTPPAPPPVLDFAALNTGAAAPAPTFPTLMSFITERIGAGRLNQAQVTAAVQAVGLESLNLVMARVDLVPAIMDELRKVAP